MERDSNVRQKVEQIDDLLSSGETHRYSQVAMMAYDAGSTREPWWSSDRPDTLDWDWRSATGSDARMPPAAAALLNAMTPPARNPSSGRLDRLITRVDRMMDGIERLIGVMELVVLQEERHAETDERETLSLDELAKAYEQEKIELSSAEFDEVYDDTMLEAMEFEEQLD